MRRLTLAFERIHTGSLILVNRSHAFADSRQPELHPALGRGDVPFDRRAETLLSRLIADIGAQSSIVPVSGWRSKAEQQAIWDSSLRTDGRSFTEKYVALPGCSEHQTGLAIDLALNREPIDFIRPHFPYSGICQIFRETAVRYGFIERYPAGKESITGIAHEPWHFRYVGAPHAQIMAVLNLTLEEYVDFLRGYPHGKRPYRFVDSGLDVEISYQKADAETALEIDDRLPCIISGNNVDGFILTVWRNYANECSARRA